MLRRKLLFYSGAGALALSSTLFVGWWQVDGPGALDSTRQRPLSLSSMNFDMIDHEAKNVGPRMLIGRATMVFFGFTFCPDVCPTTLTDISSWLNEIGEESNEINVVFITVDPERDKIETLAKYVGYFHPAIRGWAGSLEETERAAEEFGVTFLKVPSDNGEYSMNHTASVFLFDTEGHFVSTIDYHEPREFAIPKIRRAMLD